jgi:hypothetical protein
VNAPTKVPTRTIAYREDGLEALNRSSILQAEREAARLGEGTYAKLRAGSRKTDDLWFEVFGEGLITPLSLRSVWKQTREVRHTGEGKMLIGRGSHVANSWNPRKHIADETHNSHDYEKD